MKICSVPSCKVIDLNRPDVAFFRLPKAASIRDEWLEAIGNNSTQNVFVCEKHFRSKDFMAGKKELKFHAVPAVNLGDGKAEPVDSEEEFVQYGSDSDTDVIEVRDPAVGVSISEKTDVTEEDGNNDSVEVTPSSRRPSRKAALVAAKKISRSVRSGIGPSTNTEEFTVASRANTNKRQKKVIMIMQEELDKSVVPPVEVDLEMECVEEFLTPVQTELFLRTQNEHNVVTRNLKELSARGVKVIHTDFEGNVIHVPLPMTGSQLKNSNFNTASAKNKKGPTVMLRAIAPKNFVNIVALRPVF